MRITALMENTCTDGICYTEHGLSLYIETDRHKILFDTGQSGLFAENARKLNIDLAQVDTAILSHGHYDHAGGLKTFLEINSQANVYLNRRVFFPHYNSFKKKYIGMDPDLRTNPRIRTVKEDVELDEQIRLTAYNDRPVFEPIKSYGLTEETDGVQRPDMFQHEQYLILTEGSKRALISGCSHKGIYNLVKWSEKESIQVVIGGFHFMTLVPEEYEELDRAAEKLLSYPIQFYTCHCTGIEQYKYLKKRMGKALSYIEAGQTIEIV